MAIFMLGVFNNRLLIFLLPVTVAKFLLDDDIS